MIPRPELGLDGGSFFDGDASAIVAAFVAYGMVHVPCAAVGAKS